MVSLLTAVMDKGTLWSDNKTSQQFFSHGGLLQKVIKKLTKKIKFIELNQFLDWNLSARRLKIKN